MITTKELDIFKAQEEFERMASFWHRRFAKADVSMKWNAGCFRGP